MPISRSQDRDHGCAVADYRDIEADYGSLADFDTLLREAHARGIGITIDYVINHNAAQHPIFVNARDRVANAYRDWHVWQPSVPVGWSGEEIGLAGAASLSGDPRLRSPMSWTADASRAGFTTGMPYRALAANVATNNVAAQRSDASSLYAFYKAMLALRNERPSIARGSVEGAAASGNVLSFQRVLEAECTLVLVNYGGVAVNASVCGLPAGARLTPPHPPSAASTTADGAGQATITIVAQAVMVFDVQP
jgi:glycosidase